MEAVLEPQPSDGTRRLQGDSQTAGKLLPKVRQFWSRTGTNNDRRFVGRNIGRCFLYEAEIFAGCEDVISVVQDKAAIITDLASQKIARYEVPDLDSNRSGSRSQHLSYSRFSGTVVAHEDQGL